VTFDEIVQELTPDQVRKIWATFGLGVCVGELFNSGVSEEEIRIAFEAAVREQKKKQGSA
jgi:hypothetical protein